MCREETYEVVVVTSDDDKAGTTDDVFITMYGEFGDSGELPLAKSKTNVLKFSRGQVVSRATIFRGLNPGGQNPLMSHAGLNGTDIIAHTRQYLHGVGERCTQVRAPVGPTL